MAVTITNVTVRDIRFPTSLTLDGSDAVNVDPDYSATYLVLETDNPALRGYGLTFTNGRGNEVSLAAVHALKHHLLGRKLESVVTDFAGFWLRITSDSQVRWLGPEKGVIHLATGALVNAVWDLYAKAEGKPLWKLLVDMSPEQLTSAIPFRYITDALTREDALDILQRLESTKPQREAEMREHGYPAYTTSAGWLGYSDEKIRRLVREGIAKGWTDFKMKVGANLDDDVRRAQLIRDEIGPDRTLMMDANQVWDVGQAIEWMRELARFKPLWIEEPTSPDDVLGHETIARAVAPIGQATCELCQNRVMCKDFPHAK